MKALSVKQPYACLIAKGINTLEVRSWQTNYRGQLVIVSSKRPDREASAKYGMGNSPTGVTIALVDLIKIRKGRKGDQKAALVDPQGKFVWELHLLKNLPQIPVKGRLGLFGLSSDVLKKCRTAD